ncbi:MAG TPA: hypothetical protein VGB28_08085, partial [Actinomycetota bacterium]
MAGVWRKTLNYLGLVEDDDVEEGLGAAMQAEAPLEEAPPARRPSPFRRPQRPEPGPVMRAPEPEEAIVRTIPQSRPPSTGSI